MVYAGPLGQEPIAVELHNTLYVAGGEQQDGLASRASAEAWLKALGERLPVDGAWPGLEPLVELRASVRAALQNPQDAAAIAALNRASAAAPRSPTAARAADGTLHAGTDYHGASRARIVLAAFAWDTIDLLTQPHDLRACGAPGCILLFLKDHPRREWCSNACGNRARQARHYDRVRRRA
jgi:predicted RNA-binding Zn ribbon-like protein